MPLGACEVCKGSGVVIEHTDETPERVRSNVRDCPVCIVNNTLNELGIR
jgi:predicted methyltransferase